MSSPYRKKMLHLRRKNRELLDKLESNSTILQARMKKLSETARSLQDSGNVGFPQQSQLNKKRHYDSWKIRNNSGQVSAALNPDYFLNSPLNLTLNPDDSTEMPRYVNEGTMTSAKRSRKCEVPCKEKEENIESMDISHRACTRKKPNLRARKSCSQCYCQLSRKTNQGTRGKICVGCSNANPGNSNTAVQGDGYINNITQRKTLEEARSIINYSPESVFLRRLKVRSQINLNDLENEKPVTKSPISDACGQCRSFHSEKCSRQMSGNRTPCRSIVSKTSKNCKAVPNKSNLRTRDDSKPNHDKKCSSKIDHKLVKNGTHASSPKKKSTGLQGHTRSSHCTKSNLQAANSKSTSQRASYNSKCRSVHPNAEKNETPESTSSSSSKESCPIQPMNGCRVRSYVPSNCFHSKESTTPKFTSHALKNKIKSRRSCSKVNAELLAENECSEVCSKIYSREIVGRKSQGCSHHKKSVTGRSLPSSKNVFKTIQQSPSKELRSKTSSQKTPLTKISKQRHTCKQGRPTQTLDVQDQKCCKSCCCNNTHHIAYDVTNTTSRQRAGGDLIGIKYSDVPAEQLHNEWVNDISKYRQSHWFDCHAYQSSRVGSKTSLVGHEHDLMPPNHKCIHRYYLNDRLFPTPLQTDHQCRSRCSRCHLQENVENANTNPPNELPPKETVVPKKSHREVRVVLPKTIVRGPAPSKSLPGGFKIYQEHKTVAPEGKHKQKGCLLTHPITSKTLVPKTHVPLNSLALRYQKGIV